MGDLEDLTRLPDDFDGQVRLFPLPSLVLFPHAMQPLHIFEPRYCEMLGEALKTDELITMATLLDSVPQHTGKDYSSGQPAIDRIVCIGRIVSHVEREDEKHNVLLVGIKRARITSEVDAGRCFRIARIEVLDDLYQPSGATSRARLRAKLLASFGKVIPATKTVQDGLSELLAGSMGLGPITDIISHTLPLSPRLKLGLLAEQNVDRRARQLIEYLESGMVQLEQTSEEPSPESNSSVKPAGNTKLQFPPPFSVN